MSRGPNHHLRHPYAARLLGSEQLGQDLAALVSPREADALISYLARLAGADPDRSFFQESRIAANGERIVEVVGTNRLADPEVNGMVLVLADVTQHHRRADELTRRATTDGLTGRPNRLVLHDRLREASGPGARGVCDARRRRPQAHQ